MANLHKINLAGTSHKNIPSPFLKPNVPQKRTNNQYYKNHQDNYLSTHQLTPTINKQLLSKSSSVSSQHQL